MAYQQNRYGLKISPLIDAAIRPLSKQEVAGLTADLIAAGGATIPIFVRRSTNEILDGRHRFQICEANSLPYSIKILDIDSDAQALAFAINWQRHRRNASDADLAAMTSALAEAMKKPGAVKLPAGATQAIAAATGQNPKQVKKVLSESKSLSKVAEAIQVHIAKPGNEIPKQCIAGLSKLSIHDQNILHAAAKKSSDYKESIKEGLIAAQAIKKPPQPTAQEAAVAAGQIEQPGSDTADHPSNAKLSAAIDKCAALIRAIDAIGEPCESYKIARQQIDLLYETLIEWREWRDINAKKQGPTDW